MELFKLFGTIAVDHSKADEAIKQTVKQSSKIGESFSNSEKKAGKSLSQIAAESGKSMNEIRSDVGKMAAEYRKQGMSASDAMKKAYEDIGYSSEAAHKKMDDGLDKTSETAEKSESRITNAFKKIGAAITTYFAVDKLVSFGKSVVDTTASFEDGMLKVQSLSGATQDEYQKLSDAALNYGSTTAWTAKDVSDAMGFMALAGFNTNEILESTSGMLSLASASGEDLATVTDILTDSMTGFGDSASDASRYADVLATVQAKSNTTVGDLGEAFTYVSSLAGTYKYSLEDVSAALGTMANAGVKGSMAGTSLSSIITRLGTNTSGARDAIEALGVQFYNQDGTARSLGDVITDLCDATSGMDVEQKAALASTVAGAEAQKGLLAILNQGSGAYTDLQEKLNNCSGAATDMSNNMESGLGGAIRSMSSAWEGFKINLGEKFEEPLGNAIRNAASWLSETATPKIMDFIDRAVEGFEKLKEHLQPAVDKIKDAFDRLSTALAPIKEKIDEYVSSGKAAEDASSLLETALDLVSGAIELVADGINVLSGFIENIIQGFKDMKQWCSENKTALELLAVAAGTIAGLIIAANAGQIALNATMGIANGLLIAGSVAEGIMSAATTIWSGVCTVATGATTALGAAFTFLTSPISLIIIAIGAAIAVGILLYKNWDKIKEKLSELWEHIKEIWEKIRSAIAEAVEAIKEKIESGFNAVKEKVENIFNGIKDFLSTVWEGIKNVVKFALLFIGELMSAAFQIITLPFQLIWENCKDYIIAVWDFIKNAMSTALEAIKATIELVWNAIVGFIGPILETIYGLFQTVWQNVVDTITTIMEDIKNVIETVWNAIVDFLTPILETIKNIVQIAWEAIKIAITTILGVIKNVITTAWNAIKSVIDMVSNAIKSVITTVWSTIKSVITTILNAIKGVFSSIWNAIKTVVSNAINGVKNILRNKLNEAKEVVTNVLGKIRDKFKEIFDKVKDVVKNAIDKIKGFFHFEWSLPKLKMPHPKIEGEFSLHPPSVPHFSIDWYKKAMNDPILMTKPTAFGVNKDGQIMAGGEAGDEVVSGAYKLRMMIAEAVAEQNEGVITVLSKILEAILTIDENMGGNLRKALEGVGISLNRREFARLVNEVR